MDSKEILRQYMMGAIQSGSAIIELNKLISASSAPNALKESAKARYVIGFIKRYHQYLSGNASTMDICLNVRDLSLILGRIKVNDRLYKIIKENGNEIGFRTENDNHVSCDLRTPSWLSPSSYIQDVYALKQDEGIEPERTSVGDNLLKKHTIFSQYKSFEQKIAVHTALNLPDGYTLLISQPTGGGKSLVTQMLSSVSNGMTLVIVPTVALALDQYHAAQNNLNDSAEIYCYRGDQTGENRVAIIKAIKEKKTRILFASPEAIFKNSELYKLLESSAQSGFLKNVVIDEAHVVPDWGVFFRPDFQIFSIALRKWRNASNCTLKTILLSATLSDDVVETLFKLFGSEGKNKQVRCDALRQEPRFYFQSTKSKAEQDKKTIEAIKLLPKPMVVYVLEPREAVDLQKKLKNEGFLNTPVFTGETKEKDRDTILSGWKNQEYDIVLATSAFGIGVDKPDVRTIIHACCPENLSRFYQEVGRGGRNRLPSISLFMPYQNRYDGEGDVRRALGLVNKRVLTVERSVIRWNSMLHSPSAMIDADECVLDTSTPPTSMTDEEAEYAGNRNVAWNINLLLFLYRTGFIDLLDANYIQEKKAYSVKVKLLRIDDLSDAERLAICLKEPREIEYQMQMAGYRIISELVASPNSKCWGRIFKHLYPLSREVCNGCPTDPEGRITTDDIFKLRTNPDIQLIPTKASRKLSRNIGSFNEMIVRRENSGPCVEAEVIALAERANANEIGVFVAPRELLPNVSSDAVVMNYEEFYFASCHCPYLFANGMVCVLDGDNFSKSTLFKNAKKLQSLGYKCILYSNENALVMSNGKALRECVDGYTIPLSKF